MFPLIISGAVILQSIVVLPVQGVNFTPILLDGCVRTVQLVWPGMGDFKSCMTEANSLSYLGCSYDNVSFWPRDYLSIATA